MSPTRSPRAGGPLRIAVTGASGNLGTALLRRLRIELAARPGSHIVGISRRPPAPEVLASSGDSTTLSWATVDVGDPAATSRLTEIFAGCDAVVHLAWLIQPSHQVDVLHRTNVGGSRHVLAAVRAAGVGQVVAASSVGAYSPGRKDVVVDEDWPTKGVPASSYSLHKVVLESMLDVLAADAPDVVVTRVRPALIFQGDAGTEIATLFLGPLVPTRVLGRLRVPAIPLPRQLIFQAVHADDVATAIWTVIDARAPGPFNVAADPPLTPDDLAHALGARRSVPLPLMMLREVAQLAWRLRLQPTDKGWIDLASGVPIMSTERLAKLGWRAVRTPTNALDELITGMRTRRTEPAFPAAQRRTVHGLGGAPGQAAKYP